MIWLSTKEDIKEIEKIFYEQGIDKANEEILKHLEKFAKENFMSPHDMALRCVAANQPDKAMDWIEKGFELHDPQMMYIASPGNILIHCSNILVSLPSVRR